ncbi:hypothetical protein ABEF95_001580 [Exophiala dermatitidis]
MGSIQVAPLEESEVPSFVRIQIAAFPSELARILYAPSPETANKTAADHLHALRESPCTFFQKAFDPETNQIISCGRWKIYLQERGEDEIEFKAPSVSKEGPDGWKGQAKETFYRALSRYAREIVGTRPHYHLDLLMTDPDFARRGGARKILQWGIDQSEKHGLPIYLESSEVARPLYEKNGFRGIAEYAMDLKDNGISGVERVTMMLREPQTKHRTDE